MVVDRLPMTERLIVALDVPALEAAARVVTDLAATVKWFKVGSELFTAAGPQAVKIVLEHGCRVFLDLKFHDIPRTVAAAAGAAVRLGVQMMNLHVVSGEEAMRAAVHAVDGKTLLLGVTRLTSHPESPDALVDVIDAATRAKWCGLHGVIASPREATAIKAACGQEFIVVTPGIRPDGFSSTDQRRTATPAEAIAAGADYLVVGRPVLQAADPLSTVSRMLEEMEGALHQERVVSGRKT